MVGVMNQKDLVGQKCYVLRAFSGWNEPICGLESIDGKRRMTVNDWCRKEFGKDKAKSRLEQEKESLQSSIERAHRQISENKVRLQNLANDYVEWDAL